MQWSQPYRCAAAVLKSSVCAQCDGLSLTRFASAGRCACPSAILPRVERSKKSIASLILFSRNLHPQGFFAVSILHEGIDNGRLLQPQIESSCMLTASVTALYHNGKHLSSPHGRPALPGRTNPSARMRSRSSDPDLGIDVAPVEPMVTGKRALGQV
jgi:hypothetical protein